MAAELRYQKINTQRYLAGQATWDEFIAEMRRNDGDLRSALAHVERSLSAYRKRRERDRAFAAVVDSLKPSAMRATPSGPVWDGGFAQFRLEFFNMATPQFQLEIVQGYENTPLGNILMILMPPEHGKTTIFEDWMCYRLATNPSWRFLVASEKQAMAKKILGLVKDRMGRDSSFPDYVAKWGPFAPQFGDRQQPWGSEYFNVWRKKDDNRDYSVAALGIDSQVAGTRCDHLHLDDIQSKRNENQTEKIVETVSQDWLTRPGEHGIVTICGTRVAPDDCYENFDEALPADILQVVKLPAIIYDPVTLLPAPLWPKEPGTEDDPLSPGYTLEQLERLKVKVREEAWNRNYMQNPLASGARTFDDDAIDGAAQPLRSFAHPVPHGYGIITIDPSIGGRNGMASMTLVDGRCDLDMVREDRGLMTNQAIFDVLEELIRRRLVSGGTIDEVVIEAMAFQKGLVEDKQLLKMRDTYGFRVMPHLTGLNKYDPDIGLASMRRDMALGKITFPYAEDTLTRFWADELIRQMKAWRPYQRGNKLRQDLLMTMWFGWIRWKQLRGDENGQRVGSWDTKPMPFSQTEYVPITVGAQ